MWHWDRFFSKCYGFVLSISVRQCAILILMLLLSEGQTGEVKELSKKTAFLWLTRNTGQKSTVRVLFLILLSHFVVSHRIAKNKINV